MGSDFPVDNHRLFSQGSKFFSERGKHVWLIGCKGMLGTELKCFLEKTGIPYTGTDREVDITDPAALADYAKNHTGSFSWIINCAAYTAVDRAEDDAENCRRLNTEGAGNIARAAREAGASLIHISTDYVFNGLSNLPYKEDDAPDPIGIYGVTKRDGELRVLEENPESWIIRTAWLYGRYGGNFVQTMLTMMKERQIISVVNDQRGSPTWAYDLALAITSLICLVEAGEPVPQGTYHFTNEGEITWYEFAGEIYKQGRALGTLKKDCEIRPCSSKDFPARVKRPAYSVLDKAKIKKALGLEIPSWDASLNNFLTKQRYA